MPGRILLSISSIISFPYFISSVSVLFLNSLISVRFFDSGFFTSSLFWMDLREREAVRREAIPFL